MLFSLQGTESRNETSKRILTGRIGAGMMSSLLLWFGFIAKIMLTPVKFVEFVYVCYWSLLFGSCFCDIFFFLSSSGVGVEVMVSDYFTVFVSSSLSVRFLLHSPR